MSLPVVCCLSCALVCALGTVECWGGRQGGCGPELCVRRLRVCGSQLAVCLVSLFVSVCRSCVSSSSVQRPPIPRWCPVRAWLFFTFLHTYIALCRPRPCRSVSFESGCILYMSELPHITNREAGMDARDARIADWQGPQCGRGSSGMLHISELLLAGSRRRNYPSRILKP